MKQKLILYFVLMLLSTAAFAQSSNYKIAYNVLNDTITYNYEIYVMNMDGKNQKNISNSPGMDWTYATYKNKIFFISDRDTTCKRCYKLYEMDSDGNGVRKISDLVLEDSWMDSRNNGTEMVVTARIGKEIRSQLFLVNLLDGSYRQLTNDTAAYYNDPVFSPDEKQIVFRYKANKRDKKAKTELFMMNDDGGEIRQLSSYPASDTTISPNEYSAGPPKWNAKTNMVTYMSFQKGKYDVFAISPDGKKISKTLNTAMNAGYHDWTPDGKRLVVDLSTLAMKKFDIYVMNVKTKKLVQLTDSWKTEMAPVFVEATK